MLAGFLQDIYLHCSIVPIITLIEVNVKNGWFIHICVHILDCCLELISLVCKCRSILICKNFINEI